jgi:hypothetical protein
MFQNAGRHNSRGQRQPELGRGAGGELSDSHAFRQCFFQFLHSLVRHLRLSKVKYCEAFEFLVLRRIRHPHDNSDKNRKNN